ncbi:ribosome maturation factor RimM [Brevundimonas sp.]|uniref:ribosome maturation factor RimM n=1 Tax=Brevundimonas sp. TaxID=1871086 RepID=UPI00286C4C6A|nr:ribosome maturation factor RimM [Brevundimonas sp.]
MANDQKLILVGHVAGGFGVKGEVRVTAYTADPLALTAYGPLLRSDGSHGLTLTQTRATKDGVVGRAKEIATKEEADALRNLKLYVSRDAFPAPEEDEFYLADLIGVEARDAGGVVLGTVKAVQNFGADDMLEIIPVAGGQTWYLPFTKAAVPELHLSDGWLLAVRPEEVGEREPD